MSSIVNTNLTSIDAQRNLSMSQNSLATSMQRLSSGLRINSAKDDAAGLAISQRMTSQINGMDQAQRNANDGISLAQTAEGTLGTIGDNLQRIRELAVQSANASNSSSDRAALAAESNQLVSEIDRVSKQTDFNGTKLLNGSFTSQLFQVGANAGQTIQVSSIANTTAAALGNVKFAADVTGSAFTAATAASTTTGLTINGVTIADVSVTAGESAVDQGNAMASAINDQMGETGVMATANSTTGAITLSSITANQDLVIGGTVTGSGLTVGTTSAAASTASFAKDIDLTTAVGAQRALGIVDAALTTVNDSRANLGAIQNRFDSVVSNLQTNEENTTASKSRITDADFASETANLSRAQILQQAGTAMVAQANQLPQTVLSLLK